jgi:hypothetical protein
MILVSRIHMLSLFAYHLLVALASCIRWGRLGVIGAVIGVIWALDLNVMLTVAAIFAGVIVIDSIRERGETVTAWQNCGRALRWHDFIAVPLLVTIPTMALATVLIHLGGPMGWGWSALLQGSGGQSTNVNVAGVVQFPIVLGIGFALVLAWYMPRLVHVEEQIFRDGRTRIRQWAPASILFGLAHMLVGIPLGAALALVWPALMFTFVYKRAYRAIVNQGPQHDPIWRATVWHLMHNLMIVILLACIILRGVA